MRYLGDLDLRRGKPVEAPRQISPRVKIRPDAAGKLLQGWRKLGGAKQAGGCGVLSQVLGGTPARLGITGALDPFYSKRAEYDAALAELDRASRKATNAGFLRMRATSIARKNGRRCRYKTGCASVALRSHAQFGRRTGPCLSAERDFPAAEKELKERCNATANNLVYLKDLGSTIILSGNARQRWRHGDIIAKAERPLRERGFIRAALLR